MDVLNLPDEGISSLFRQRSRQDRSRLRRLVRFWPFLLFVMAPTVVAAVYYIGIAAPQYVSEAQFVVRGQGSQTPGMLTSLLMAGSGGTASEDTYAVQDYLTSRDAAALMARTQDLRAVFADRRGDALARFPNPLVANDFEHFFRYYQNHVTAELDTTTSISTLSVRTFKAADSQRIATALLAAAEQLINQMNARQRQNMVSSAEGEVAAAEARLRDIGQDVAAYRNRQALLDPMKQSVPMLKEIADLQAMLTTTRVQLAQLRVSAPGSPLIAVYQHRIDALERQIAVSNQHVTGSNQSLVPKITTFDDLTVQQDLAEKQLLAAATALETAKAQADRQQLYLEEITRPNLPDYAAYPKIIKSILVVFASFLGLFVMGRLIINGAREHRVT